MGFGLISETKNYRPVRTFDTACTYFHKFRLNFRDAEYNYQDAALASLFVACKVEDTIKKSKDILAAAYNVKNPEKPAASDDKVRELYECIYVQDIRAQPRLTRHLSIQIFESPGKIIIGLERLILETIGFDFRTRYPQKLLVKVVRSILGPDEGKSFFNIAYAMSIDMYKTFVPIKRTTFSMVMALVELTARMTGEHLDKVQAFVAQRRQYSRPAVLETMLDILDLYVQYHKSTNVGAQFDLNRFMDIKIALNTELEKEFISRHMYYCSRCENEDAPPVTPGSVTSPTATTSSWPGDASMRRTARGQDGTMRFVFDPEAAREEQDTVAQFYNEEYEEYEVEVEEPIPPPRYEHAEGGGGRGGYRGGHGHHGSRDRGDHRRGGPYGGYRGDRHYRGRRYH